MKRRTRKGQRQVTATAMTNRQSAIHPHSRFIRRPVRALGLAVFLGGAALVPGAPLAAQDGSPFSVVMKINDMVITQYELDQRMRFLTLLRIPGDPQENALKGLLNDRLAQQEAKKIGLRLTRDQIESGMTEFASRANLSAEEFVAALAEGGVEAETFRDFAANGLMWRELVRAKYGPVTSISETEIDRAIANGTTRTAMQLLLSEIIIPVDGDPEDELALANQIRQEVTTEAGFVSAARRYSASPSAGRGGRMDWVSASNLPPQLVQLVLALGPGQVSQPVQLPEAVAIFQLRDLTEDTTVEPPKTTVEYAQFLLPNTAEVASDAAALAARVDTCKDLWAEARSFPQGTLTVEKKPLSEVPRDIALELAQLDVGEYSTALARGSYRTFLMLCAREPLPEGEEAAAIDREAVRGQLMSAKLQAQSEAWLEELRSEAIISEQ